MRKQLRRTLKPTDPQTRAANAAIQISTSSAAILVASCASEQSVSVRPPFDESQALSDVPGEGIRDVAAGDVCLKHEATVFVFGPC